MRVKNFEKFQHFKDRSPPWVKLYRDILDDIEWFELDPAAAKTLVMLWLIASEDETKQGLLPCTKTLAFRLRMKETEVKNICIKLAHWLEHDDIDPISRRYQDDGLEKRRDREETEGERETDSPEKAKATATASRLPADWSPSGDDFAFCATERKDLNPNDVASRFRDYWIAQPGAKGRKLDWPATWRNWVRNEKLRSIAPQVIRQTVSDQRKAASMLLTGRTQDHERQNATAERDITIECLRVA